MSRILLGSVSLASLLLCSAAVAFTVHSHRAWHSVVWRTDAAAAAEGAHTSFRSIWREYREAGRVPGQRAGRRLTLGELSAMDFPTVPARPVTREYVSLAMAHGRVEYRRYPEAPPPFM
jgi:hypothetical protein